MKKAKTNVVLNENKFGGYRAEAQEYNHIINDYLERLVVIKESNDKRRIH